MTIMWYTAAQWLLALPSFTCAASDLWIVKPGDEQAWFNYLAVQHSEICKKCEFDGVGSTLKSTNCCGSCSCQQQCKDRGNCCLDVYKSFEEARNSTDNSRYSCVRPQYLPPNETDFNEDLKYWMITKCSPTYSNRDNINVCDNPGYDDILESVIPVTDIVTYRHYRNKFCAFCNGVKNEQVLFPWKIKIFSDNFITLPDRDILKKIKSVRGNMIFVKPELNFVYIDDGCDEPPYSMSVCNSTGKWKNREEYIEVACASFVDPFNLTYKNYFCYLCNTDQAEMPHNPPVETMKCGSLPASIETKQSAFYALWDLDSITGEENSYILKCGTTQFPDPYKMVCRDVLCHKSRYLSKGICEPLYVLPEIPCIGIFIKLTPFRPIPRHLDKFLNVTYFLEISNVAASIEDLRFYSFTEDRNIEFVIIYLTLQSSVSSDYIAFVEAVTKIEEIDGATYIPTEVQHSLYNITFSGNGLERTAEIVMSEKNTSSNHVNLRVIDTGVSVKPNTSCFKQNVTLITKLNTCPYVKLDPEDILGIKNDYLYVQYGNLTTSFPRWEYQLQGNEVYICLDDLTQMLKEFTGHSKIMTHSSVTKHPKNNLFLICMYLFVCLSAAKMHDAC